MFFRVSSENNARINIIERVIAQALHEHGGQERCPWTRVIMGRYMYTTIHHRQFTVNLYKGCGCPWGKENDCLYRYMKNIIWAYAIFAILVLLQWQNFLKDNHFKEVN